LFKRFSADRNSRSQAPASLPLSVKKRRSAELAVWQVLNCKFSTPEQPAAAYEFPAAFRSADFVLFIKKMRKEQNIEHALFFSASIKKQKIN
jgi:hypothetical protein